MNELCNFYIFLVCKITNFNILRFLREIRNFLDEVADNLLDQSTVATCLKNVFLKCVARSKR